MSIWKSILFLKFVEFNSFQKFYIWACCYVLHWNLVFVIYTICFAQFLHINTLTYTNYIQIFKLFYILSKFYPVQTFDCRWNNNLIRLLCKRNICFYNWKLNFVLFLGHFLVNISTTISTTLVKDFSWSLFSIKFQSLESLFKKISGLQTCNSIKKWLRHRCFHVNIAKFLKILKNICDRLLLT